MLQTPESMKNWVQKLRYIKAYWSKVQVRETIISEEQERKLLEKLLQEEEDEDGVSARTSPVHFDNLLQGSRLATKRWKLLQIVVKFSLFP